MNIDELQDDLLIYFESRGSTTSLSISKLCNMQQSTVYRSLWQKRPKVTRGLIQLCNYANIKIENYTEVNPGSNEILMNTLRKVWNGSNEHAKELSRLILAAHSCKMRS